MKNLSFLIVLFFLTLTFSCGEQDKINGITQLDQQNALGYPCYNAWKINNSHNSVAAYLTSSGYCSHGTATGPTEPETPPDAPALTQLVSVPANNTIKVFYSDVLYETRFVFYRCTNTVANPSCGTVASSMTKLQLEMPGCPGGTPDVYIDQPPNAQIIPGNYYEYRVKACKNSTCSDFSNKLTVFADYSTGVDPITAPALISPADNANLPGASVMFQWGAAYTDGSCVGMENEVGFIVHLKNEQTGSTILACSVLTTSGTPASCNYSFGSTGSGTIPYSWFVEARDWCNHYKNSSTRHFTH